MSKLQIGQLCPDGVLGLRDAFHVPCVLVRCGEIVSGGESVRFKDSSFTEVELCHDHTKMHGIVDPFISEAKPYEKFFMLLKPGTVAERLTHHFDIHITDVPKVDEPEDDYEDQCKGCW